MSRKKLLPVAVVICFLFGRWAVAQVSIPGPVVATAPAAVVASWNDLSGAELKLGSSRPLAVEGPTPMVGRADVFLRHDGRWTWAAAWKFSATAPLVDLPPTTDRVGVLIRFRETATYGWGEEEPSTRPVVVRLYKTLSVQAGEGGATIAVYVAGTDTPRVIVSKERAASLPFVPLAASLVCAAYAQAPSACVVVPAPTEHASGLQSGTQRHAVRVVQTPASTFRVSAIAPSYSAVRPKNIAVTSTQVARWMLVDIENGDEPDVAIDFASDAFAKQRLMLRDIAVIPAFATFDPASERGVAIRPSIRGVDVPVERGATLLALPPERGPQERLPLGHAVLDADGVFRFSDLGAGTYRLKLIAALAGNQPVEISLATGDPTSVIFASGPLVKGKLELHAGGTVNDPPQVEIIRSGDIVQAEGADKTAGDIADWYRTAAVTEDGSFAAVIPIAGPYTLRARWGKGTATLEVIMKPDFSTVDVGTIPLIPSATVRGIVRDCASGEARFIPMPDLAHPARLMFSDLRRVPIGADGAFYVDGVTSGTWMLGANCAGRDVLLEPNLVTVEDRDLVIYAHPTARVPVALPKP